jgi:hypothetical protein
VSQPEVIRRQTGWDPDERQSCLQKNGSGQEVTAKAATPSQRRLPLSTCKFDVHTAETLMGVAELHWRAASRAAQSAQDDYDAARRLYAAARTDCTVAAREASATGGGIT